MNGPARPRNQKLVPIPNARVLIGTKSVFSQKELENRYGSNYTIFLFIFLGSSLIGSTICMGL